MFVMAALCHGGPECRQFTDRRQVSIRAELHLISPLGQIESYSERTM
jgi:hypothetical protein